jgi:hypothetical protein
MDVEVAVVTIVTESLDYREDLEEMDTATAGTMEEVEVELSVMVEMVEQIQEEEREDLDCRTRNLELC